MSELVSNPQELAQQLADQHRAAQAEAAMHQFVDVTNKESLDDFNAYFESRPSEDGGTDMLKKSHYDETLVETANQYEEMSMTDLAKELAEATVAKDMTKFTEVSDVLNNKVSNFVDAQKSERTEGSEPSDLPEGNREQQVKNVYNRLGKVMKAEQDRLTAEKQPVVSPDITETTPEQGSVSTDELTPSEKLAEIAKVEEMYKTTLAKATAEGDQAGLEMLKTVKEQIQNAKNQALEAMFKGVSNEELRVKLEGLTSEEDKTEHDRVVAEMQRRFAEARAQDEGAAQEGGPVDAEGKKLFTEMSPSEKLVRIAEMEAMFDANIAQATDQSDIDALYHQKAQMQVLRNEALKAMFEGVSDEDLQNKYDSLTDEADKDEREQVRLEMWRRYGEANTQDDGSQAAPEAQPAGKKGWMKRIKDRVKGSRATTAVLTGNVVDGSNGGDGNNDTPERSRRRGCGPILGAAALVAAAVAFGVVAKQKGWDINPFDGDGFSFDNGTGIKSPYNEKFYDYISGTAEFKEANPTVTLPSGEVVSWIPDAPNYDLTAYDQYMNGLLDQMNS